MSLDQFYHLANATYYGRVREVFGNSLDLFSHMSGAVLDFGCSFGETTRELRDLFPNSRVMGIDLDKISIMSAREQNPDLEFLVEDGFNPVNLKNRKFDLVFCLNNLYVVLTRDFCDRNNWFGRSYLDCKPLILNVASFVREEGYFLVGGVGKVEVSKPSNGLRGPFPYNYVIMKKSGGSFECVDKYLLEPDFIEVGFEERMLELLN